MNEADTCRKFVVPKLQAAGWENRPHAINEQKSFTDGRVVFVGGKARRGKQKRSDYLLRYNPDFPIAVVEAKSRYRHAADGLQQAKEYAEILGLQFAYSTNGSDIVEFDYTTGVERTISDFPAPDELWHRLRRSEGILDDLVADRLLTPTFPDRAKPLRYYQEIAVNRSVQAVLQGRKRALLTLCTGAGKTAVAFQICWKLWSARWNSKGTNRNPKVLFLADRNVLVDDPMAKDFSPFGDARHKISGGEAVKSRDMYFAIYQSIARDENRPGLYREYRGGWTWYTGSASWFYRVALESILGFTKRGDRLTIRPCVPSSWPGYRVHYQVGRARYEIDVRLHPADSEHSETVVTVDGQVMADHTIVLHDDGATHRVQVRAPASSPRSA